MSTNELNKVEQNNVPSEGTKWKWAKRIYIISTFVILAVAVYFVSTESGNYSNSGNPNQKLENATIMLYVVLFLCASIFVSFF